jgi:hypothetical protein
MSEVGSSIGMRPGTDPRKESPMRIDCERCPRRRGDRRCEDCLVTFVLELEGGSGALEEADDEGEVVLDAREANAVRALSDAGLLERVRLIPLEDAG